MPQLRCWLEVKFDSRKTSWRKEYRWTSQKTRLPRSLFEGFFHKSQTGWKIAIHTVWYCNTGPWQIGAANVTVDVSLATVGWFLGKGSIRDWWVCDKETKQKTKNLRRVITDRENLRAKAWVNNNCMEYESVTGGWLATENKYQQTHLHFRHQPIRHKMFSYNSLLSSRHSTNESKAIGASTALSIRDRCRIWNPRTTVVILLSRFLDVAITRRRIHHDSR